VLGFFDAVAARVSAEMRKGAWEMEDEDLTTPR